MSRLHRPRAGAAVRLCVAVIYPVAAVLFRLRFRHLDRIPPPRAGAVIIAVNHLSAVDTMAIARLVWQAGRVPRFLVKSEIFRWPLLGAVLRRAGQIPVHRGTRHAADSLHAAVAALDAGQAVVLYPEGGVTSDPHHWPMRARTGIARLVLLRPDVPVVPVAQWGAQHRSARGAPLRRTVHAVVGEPVDLSRFAGRAASADVLGEITDVIMRAVTAGVAALRAEPSPIMPMR